MTQPIRSVLVVGAGSAGLLASMALKRSFPELKITVVHSRDIPVIGVGESTTAAFPTFLHQGLGLDVREFFQATQPSWKLGIRFIWGDPADEYFNYTFDNCMGSKPAPLRKMPPYYCLHNWADASRYWALMDRGLSPCFPQQDGSISIHDSFGYHIDNEKLTVFLTAKAKLLGVEFVEGNIQAVRQDSAGRVNSILLEEERRHAADFYLDCSGFRSRLLHEALQQPYVSYEDSLYCDRAVVGMWSRDDDVLPYTTAETMDHGWCWQIGFLQHVTRGYVYSSGFCTDEEALQEFRAKNPKLGDTRTLRFRSGRYENFCVGNVAALGNACGFVEPLEATALLLIVEQIRLLCRILSEAEGSIVPQLQHVANERYRQLWDEVRDFLAVHYRFNRRNESPFWKHCRENTDLGGAAEMVELYANAGPTTLCDMVLPSAHLFGYDGFMSLMVGQRVPTEFAHGLNRDDLQRWDAFRADNRSQVAAAMPMRQALQLFCS